MSRNKIIVFSALLIFISLVARPIIQDNISNISNAKNVLVNSSGGKMQYNLISAIEGVRVLVMINEIPVLIKNDSQADRGMVRLNQFLRSGENRIDVLAQKINPDTNSQASIVLELRSSKSGGSPMDDPILLEYSWDPSQKPLNNKQQLDSLFTTTFIIEDSIGPWAWESAEPLPNTDQLERDLYNYLKSITLHFQSGDMKSISPHFELRNREIALALNIDEERVNTGFSKSIEMFTTAKDYSVEISPQKDIKFNWFANRRLVIPTNSDGSAVITIMADGMEQQIEMIIGKLEDNWVILR